MKKRSSSLILLLLLSSVILAFLGIFDFPVTRFLNSGARNQGKTDEIVNRHLKQTYYQMERDKVRVMIENSAVNPQVGKSILPPTKDVGVDMEPDRNEEVIARDLDRSKGSESNYKIDHQIQGQLQDQENEKMARESYQSEYAKQFVENARQKGWDVQLDENYVVISVRPIKKRDANMPLFVPNGGGSR
jgi:hypothetical protein